MEQLKLTRVEELILSGASFGLDLVGIGNALGLTESQVGKQVAEIYSKLHVIAQKRSSTPDTGVLPGTRDLFSPPDRSVSSTNTHLSLRF